MVFIEGHAGAEVRYTALRILNFWEAEPWFLRGDGGVGVHALAVFARFWFARVCCRCLALGGIGRAMRERIQPERLRGGVPGVFPGGLLRDTCPHTGYRNPLDPMLVLFASLLLCGTQMRERNGRAKRAKALRPFVLFLKAVQNQFDASGYAQFVEDAEEIVATGVFA